MSKENLKVESSTSPPRDAIRSHLVQVLTSPPFESSKRSRELLSYLVEKTLMGEAAGIKERTLGESVFGRPGYEPSEQNAVRVAANELRKRLALFYEAHADAQIHIDLPRGSYVPVFRARADSAPPPAPAPEARPAPRRRWWYVAAATAALLAALIWTWVGKPAAERAFWEPVMSAGKPALIWATGWGAVMTAEARDAILKHEPDEQPYTVQLRPGDVYPVDQLISFGHVHGIGAIVSWLSQHGRPPELRLGNWNVPADIRDRPLILFGALNNPWSVEMNRNLRFRVVHAAGPPAVVDQNDPKRRWAVDWRRRGYDQSLDYGIITRIIDPSNGQVRISIGGICHYSSQAAAEFLTTPRYWNQVERVAPRGWERMNLQAVLEVRVVEKVPQSPRLVAWHFW